MRAPLIIATIAAAMLSGCFGADSDTQSSVDTGDDPDDGNTTYGGVDTNTTVEANTTSGNTTAEANATVTTYDNRTGSVSGTGTVVGDPDQAEETIEVRNGTVQLWFDLSVEGDDVTMQVRPPGCEDDDCAEDVDVASGEGSFQAEAPAEGDWTVLITADSDVGPYSSDYTLVVGQEIPA